ncbi:hypothetical protein [Halorussus sp. MSC15.2]|uniref:DUF7310 family coiled-coil domain-containing protein n=1 Tax=Halorussus sp. MSC15.2 TaxID=2283638 RepID=UPI0013D013AE|nr:hypothetical protein [Halorussus sp. MSC15.2]NEU57549.1 hypothetical protein [Halorussus sp. MSC15.2]
MSDHDALDERLRAVERTLTDDDCDLTDLRSAAELTGSVETLAERLDDAEDRLDELDAATQALRGYVGNVRAVNDSVERRADAALAKAETLESELTDARSDSDTNLRRRTGTRPADVAPKTRPDRPDPAAGPDGQRECELCRRAETDTPASETGPNSRLLARIAESLRGLP